MEGARGQELETQTTAAHSLAIIPTLGVQVGFRVSAVNIRGHGRMYRDKKMYSIVIGSFFWLYLRVVLRCVGGIRWLFLPLNRSQFGPLDLLQPQ